MPENVWKICSGYARVLNMLRYSYIIIITIIIIIIIIINIITIIVIIILTNLFTLKFLSAQLVNPVAQLPFNVFLTWVNA